MTSLRCLTFMLCICLTDSPPSLLVYSSIEVIQSLQLSVSLSFIYPMTIVSMWSVWFSVISLVLSGMYGSVWSVLLTIVDQIQCGVFVLVWYV